jgi:hypothetical protein
LKAETVLQRALEVLAYRPAALLDLIPSDCAVFVAMPLGKQLLLQGQRLRFDPGDGRGLRRVLIVCERFHTVCGCSCSLQRSEAAAIPALA